MNNLAPAPAGSRENPSSSDDLGTTDTAESLVAHDDLARVGEEHSVHPNPLGPIGDPPSVSNDTDREVAALKAQVGDLTRMFRAFLAQQMPVTPPSLSAASASPEVSSAQQQKSNDSLSSFVQDHRPRRHGQG